MHEGQEKQCKVNLISTVRNEGFRKVVKLLDKTPVISYAKHCQGAIEGSQSCLCFEFY